MKNAFVSILIICMIFVLTSFVYAQSIELKTESDSSKSKDGEDGKDVSKAKGYEDWKYDDYKDNPLYKEMVKLVKESSEVKQKINDMTQEIYKKYDMKNITKDQKAEMYKELMQVYKTEEYQKLHQQLSDLSKELNKVKTELDEMVDKALAKRYDVVPHYEKMIEAKDKLAEALKTLNEEINKLKEEYMNNKTEEQKLEFYEKLKELQEPYNEATKAYQKAKADFESSICKAKDAEDDEKDEDN